VGDCHLNLLIRAAGMSPVEQRLDIVTRFNRANVTDKDRV
jgi:hypothetical protein